MKKSKKIWIGITCGTVIAVVTASLLGVYIPQLLTTNNLSSLVEQQVKPTDGIVDGSVAYLRSTFKNALGEQKSNIGHIKDFATKSLNSTNGYKSTLNNLVNNFIVQFFKNFKGSDAYAERYKTWINDINKEWDDTVKSYQDKHGGSWEYYFQVNVLDPVGGNEADWKREKLFSNVESAFNEFLFQNLYISGLDANGNPVTPTGNPSTSLTQYLYSGGFVNGTDGNGTPNKIKFMPNAASSETIPYAGAIADLQSFIFDNYVEDKLPVVTTMTLYKHVAPQKDGKSKFFNIEKARQLNNPIDLTDVVPVDASYMWQTFAPEIKESDSSADFVPTATNKYLDFVKNRTSLEDPTTGAINIPAKTYTDDSATLYYIKMSDVFSTSFTQYAAASNYKLNNLLFAKTDANVPTATTFKTNMLNSTPGTEIMNNFMSTEAKTGFFNLPQQIKQIINTNPSYGFVGGYDGITAIADSIDITNTPYMITRNEAGVHIIGIDRYSKIKAAATYQGKITEIKNTILWRYILGEFNLSQNTGFTLDLKSELQTYFNENRDCLLFEYIAKNELTPPADSKTYIFSDTFTNVNNIPKLTTSIYYEYIKAWNEHTVFSAKTKHKDLVKEKVLGLQTPYLDKIYGNSVVNNGIAGVLPYYRTPSYDASPIFANNGVVDKTYGMYINLDVYKSDGTSYKEIDAETKLKNIKNTLTPVVYTALEKQNIGLKHLTYSSAKYNQYLEIGTSTPPFASSNEYISDGDIVNEAVASWITTDEPKQMIEIQKVLSDINYDATTVGEQNVVNSTNWALADAYTDPSTLATAPTIPTSTSTFADKRKYINYHLQNAYDNIKKIPLIYDNMTTSVQNGTTYTKFIELARQKWATSILLNPESSTTNNSFLKEVAAIKYAFDYNETTHEYEFTKFRDYLLDQTSNYKKASYVWVTNEKINLIQDDSSSAAGGGNKLDPYKNATKGVKELYKFKENIMTKNAGAYGYAYQGAENNYRVDNNTEGLWKNNVTFNDNKNYFNQTKLTYNGTNNFTGFTGMQFETNSSADLNPSIRDDLFSGNTRVFDGYNVDTATTAPDNTTIKIKGVLYNVGTVDNFKNLIDSEIYSWRQANQLIKWYNDTLGIDTSGVSTSNLSIAKQKLKDLAAQIPTEVFTRNVSSLLVNRAFNPTLPGSSANPAFYYDGTTTGYYNTAIFTQFNYNDVIKLFDINNDSVINADDKGINWTIAATGFLGSSAEAFFISAFNWYLTQTSFATTTFNDIIDRQAKVLVYDRRLNNSLGKSLVQNYKEDNTNR